jgi:hypothetical protein
MLISRLHNASENPADAGFRVGRNESGTLRPGHFFRANFTVLKSGPALVIPNCIVHMQNIYGRMAQVEARIS